MASDSPYQNLSQYFSTCNDFIHNARVQSGCNVLIHCLAGMSRSVTIVVAYIMSITSFQLNEAQKVVRGARPVSNPNSGFQKQLQEFEASTRLFEERRRMLEKFPGTTFLESDVEYCKRLLVSYNNLLLSRSICEGRCHSARICPTGTCRNRYASPSRLARLRSTEGLEPGTSGTSKVSPSGSPTFSGYAGSSRPSSQSNSAQNSPAKGTIWERHYGCLKEHFRSRQMSAVSASNSTPASPIHYRVGKNSRSDSVASISSIASVTSLPAHLPATPRLTGPVYTSSSSTSARKVPSSPVLAATSSPSNRSCPPTPRRSSNRRQLPETGSVSGSGTPTFRGKGTSVNLRGSKAILPIDLEDEDETMTVVLHSDPSSSKSSTATTASIWTTPSTSRLPSQPVTSRPSTGITRWVMKRSAYRYNTDNQ